MVLSASVKVRRRRGIIFSAMAEKFVVIAAFVPLMNRYCSFFMGKNIKDISK